MSATASTLHGAQVRGYDATLVDDAHATEDQTEWRAPHVPDASVTRTERLGIAPGPGRRARSPRAPADQPPVIDLPAEWT
jgi:hypothetical protein